MMTRIFLMGGPGPGHLNSELGTRDLIAIANEEQYRHHSKEFS